MVGDDQVDPTHAHGPRSLVIQTPDPGRPSRDDLSIHEINLPFSATMRPTATAVAGSGDLLVELGSLISGYQTESTRTFPRRWPDRVGQCPQTAQFGDRL
jgi:hypothetical protein